MGFPPLRAFLLILRLALRLLFAWCRRLLPMRDFATIWMVPSCWAGADAEGDGGEMLRIEKIVCRGMEHRTILMARSGRYAGSESSSRGLVAVAISMYQMNR